MKIAACRGWVILLFRASASFLYETLFYPPFFQRTMRKFSELNSCGVLPSIHSSLFLLAVIWLHMHFCKHVYKYNMDVQVLIVPNYPSFTIHSALFMIVLLQSADTFFMIAGASFADKRSYSSCMLMGRKASRQEWDLIALPSQVYHRIKR